MGGLREVSLWDELGSLWVRFLRVGGWEVPGGVSVGLLVGERPPLVAFLPLRQQKGEGLAPACFSPLLCSFCVTSLDKCLGVQPLPNPQLLMSGCPQVSTSSSQTRSMLGNSGTVP